jgi:hypothetical protein
VHESNGDRRVTRMGFVGTCALVLEIIVIRETDR